LNNSINRKTFARPLNLLLYYIEDNPRRNVSPDVFVVRGAGNHQRRVYKLWEEGRPPDVVIEISSAPPVSKTYSVSGSYSPV
jgi:Uma2 family endonuclease